MIKKELAFISCFSRKELNTNTGFTRKVSTMSRERIKTIGTTLMVLLSMSVGTILTKISFRSIEPVTYMWMSLLIGIIAMNLYTFVFRKECIPWKLMTKKVWLYIIQIGFFNFVTGRLGVFALSYLKATTRTYLGNFVGFLTMAMSCIILHEIPTRYQVLGAAIAFAGLRVYFLDGPQGGEWIGIIMILISILSIAYTNNIARKLALETNQEISNNIISTLAVTIGGTVMIIICIAIGEFPPVVPEIFNWVVLLYSGIVTTAVGLTVWNFILRTLRSYEASILGATTVIWTSLLAVIFLNELLEMNQIAGIVMMFAGICLVQFRKQEKAVCTGSDS